METASEKLSKRLTRWPENRLDQVLAPHPSLGDITIRALLYFTLSQTGHYTNSPSERYPTN
jgi:hypothetical protein